MARLQEALQAAYRRNSFKPCAGRNKRRELRVAVLDKVLHVKTERSCGEVGQRSHKASSKMPLIYG